MSNLRAVVLLLLIIPSNVSVPAQTAGPAALGTIPPDESQHREAVTSGYGVEPLLTRPIPHPYVLVGPSLMGGGYATFAYRLEGGLDIESSRWIMLAVGAYDNGRQVRDGDQPNPKGHDRYLDSSIYFRPAWQPFPGQAFVGCGWRWNQLSTTNYTKTANRPQVGGGYDLALRSCSGCRRDFSMRISVDWVMVGNDWQNGSHGPAIAFSLPTPREKRHWFYQQRVGVFRFHDTVTDPTNVVLTRLQRADRSLAAYVESGIMYRF
jgi:hypothetical protein